MIKVSAKKRTLEADGLIDRKVYAVVSPKVDYRLTDVGKSLLPLIDGVGADEYEECDDIPQEL